MNRQEGKRQEAQECVAFHACPFREKSQELMMLQRGAGKRKILAGVLHELLLP
jgi:hypothetical protein